MNLGSKEELNNIQQNHTLIPHEKYSMSKIYINHEVN